eukprot:798012-Amphidinium_carterae.1
MKIAWLQVQWVSKKHSNLHFVCGTSPNPLNPLTGRERRQPSHSACKSTCPRDPIFRLGGDIDRACFARISGRVGECLLFVHTLVAIFPALCRKWKSFNTGKKVWRTSGKFGVFVCPLTVSYTHLRAHETEADL